MPGYRFLRSLNGPFTKAGFDDLLKRELLTVESGPNAVPQPAPYDDGIGIPTIGIGFNLRTWYAVVARHMGLDPGTVSDPTMKAIEQGYLDRIRAAVQPRFSAATISTLNEIMAERASNPALQSLGITKTTFTLSNAEIDGVYQDLYTLFHADLESVLPGVPYSSEQVALMSLSWDGKKNGLVGPKLVNAISHVSRAEAWYEIRYDENSTKNSNNIRGGIANRRYLEAAVFSLHDSGSMNKYQASEIYDMFTKHKDTILSYEAAFNPKIVNPNYNNFKNVEDIDGSLKVSHDFLVKTYAGNMQIGIRGIYASKDQMPSIGKLESGSVMLIGNGEAQTLNGVRSRDNTVVALGANSTLTGGDHTNYLINDSNGSATFKVNSGGTMAIGRDGIADTFNVDLKNVTKAPVLFGGQGEDIFNISVADASKVKIKIVNTTHSIGDYSYFDSRYSALASDADKNTIIIINPDSQDKIYINGQLLTPPEIQKRSVATNTEKEAINDNPALVHETQTTYALTAGDIWYTPDPGKSDGAAAYPDQNGTLSARIGEAQIQFAGFTNGLFGITLPTGGYADDGEADYYFTNNRGNFHASFGQFQPLVPPEFFDVDPVSVDDAVPSETGETMAARALQLADAQNPLIGTAGADNLDPAGTYDFVSGGGGGDTIHYHVGYGAVTIDETDSAISPANSLAFGSSITPADVSVEGDADGNLILSLGGADVVTLASALLSVPGTTHGVQSVTFADGTFWSYADLLARALDPSSHANVIAGDHSANILDTQGMVDTAVGGGGGDTFVFEAGYGSLVIDETDIGPSPANVLSFGEGIDPADVTVRGDENGDLYLDADGDEVQIVSALLSTPGNARGVQQVTFADGTTWSYAQLLAKAGTPVADGDTIVGDAAANTLDTQGLVGSVIGFGGGDTFAYELGYGSLTIDETDSSAEPSNTLAFGAGIDPDDIQVLGSGDGDIVLWLNAYDQVTLSKALESSAGTIYGVQQVTFADGTVWDYADLLGKVSTASAGTVAIYGDSTANTLDVAGIATFAVGGGGGDTFVYQAGYGSVVIDELDEATAPTNTLALGSGIDPANVVVTGSADGSIVLTFSPTDSVTLTDMLADRSSGVQSVTFADGTHWSYADLIAKATQASAANTSLFGDADANTFDTLGVAHVVTGGGGGDHIIYEAGYDDLLINEAELQSSGAVNVLELGAGISPDDVSVSGNADGALLLSLPGGVITLANALSSDDDIQYGVAQVAFDDGTTWSFADLLTRAGTASGSGATIYGDGSANLLTATNQIASIVGGGGGDTIQYDLGDGPLAITEVEHGDATNTLAFGNSVDPASITVSADGNDILLSLGGSDQVRLVDALADDAEAIHGVQSVTFANGAQWSVAQLAGFLTGEIDIVPGPGDIVIDSAANPVGAVPALNLDPAFSPGDVEVVATEQDRALVLRLSDGGAIVLRNALDAASAQSQRVVFADGTVWDYADLLARSRTASEYNTSLVGTAAGEEFDSNGQARHIDGGGGGDTFVYNKGYGKLSIDERDASASPDNVLAFGADIDPASVQVSADSGGNLIFALSDQDQVTIEGALNSTSGEAKGIQSVIFADGTAWSYAQILAKVMTPTAGIAEIYGDATANVLDPGGLVHAANGGGGGDTFVYDRGYGSLRIDEADQAAHPTNEIVFGSGISASDITLQQSGTDLFIDLGNGDQIWLGNQAIPFDDGANYGIQRLVFDDGSDMWLPTTLYGTAGGDDFTTLDHVTRLVGGGGGDTIHFTPGNGSLTIAERDDGDSPANVLSIGGGILPTDVTVRADESASIYLDLGNGETITLENALGTGPGIAFGVQDVAFSDGTHWSYADLLDRVGDPANSVTGEIFGDASANVLDGAGTATTIYGGGGGDTFVYQSTYGDLSINEADLVGGAPNVLDLGAGILPSDVTVAADNGALTLTIGATGAVIRLENALLGDDSVAFGVQQVHFTDGTVWDYDDLLTSALVPSGPTIEGDANANVLDGQGIATTIIGHGGGDTIRYASGYGDLSIREDTFDTDAPANVLAFDTGIDPADVQVAFDPTTGQMRLGLADGSVITVENMVSDGPDGPVYQGPSGIDGVTFASGEQWDRDDLWHRAQSGWSGNTELIGGDTAETFDPKGFANLVTPGGGGDTIIYKTGYGEVTIDEADRPGVTNKLVLGEDITPSGVAVHSDGDDLVLDFGNDDTVRLIGGRLIDPQTTHGVEQVVFADGTIWSDVDLRNRSLVPSTGQSTIFGTEGADVIDSLGIAHQIHGLGGGDLVRYERGYGVVSIDEVNNTETPNTLAFGTGILPSDVTLTLDGQGNLFMSLGSGDAVSLTGFLNSLPGIYRGFDLITFADGTSWTRDDLFDMLNTPSATNTTLTGDGTPNEFDPAGIANLVIGNGGGDLIHYAIGYGALEIQEQTGYILPGASPNTLSFAAGIAPTQVVVSTIDLGDGQQSIQLDLGDADVITIRDAYSSDNAAVRVQFADGTLWSAADIREFADAIRGTAGDDNLVGTSDNDVLYGAAGNDILQGLAGNDVLDGGAGNDTLYGGDGDDVYRFAPGDGQDLVADFPSGSGTGGVDTIQLGAGILPADVSVTQAHNGADLVLSFAGSSDQITLSNAIGSSLWRIEQVTFANGTNWSYSDLMAKATTPTSGNDIIYGDESSQTLSGGAGNDNLYGARGDDILIGGTGNDYLNGGPGSDTYVFAQGDGNDTIDDTRPSGSVNSIQLGAGMTQQNTFVTTSANGLDIVVGFIDSSDTISIRYMNISTSNGVDQIKFADGSSWSSADIMARRTAFTAGDDTITGSSGNETLYGGDGNDTLLGLAGNDSLAGGAGNDTLTGGAGNDVLNGGSGSDIAVFAGLQNDYQLTTSGGALSITDLQPTVSGDDGTDQLIGVETAQFSDQSVSLAAPVILDLDGNGVSLVDRTQSTTSFDWNGDGVADHTGWTGQGDAFLALDRNHDGRIDSVAELSFANDKPGAKSDLDGLSAFDSNGDGKLSADDSAFGDFRVWQDTNANGVSDAGEVKSLTDAGIAAIDLTGSAVNQSWAWDANVTINTGTFERTDGSVGQLADAALNYELSALPPAVGVAANLGQSGNWRLPHDWAKPFGPPRLRMPIEPLGDLASTNGDLDHFRAASSFSEQLAAFVPESAPDWTGRNQGEKTDDIWFANHRRSDGSLLTQSGASIF